MRDAKAGDAVARVLRKAQDRQRVLDMRGVEEFQAAEFDERNVAPRQLQLQRRAVMGGAKQHRLRFQAGPRFAVLEHARRDIARLIGLLADGRQNRRRAGGAVGPQVLGETLRAEADHRVGRGEDRPGRAIIAIERDEPRRRIEGGGKVEDVAHGGGAERIDRLRVVADHRQPAPARAQRQHDLALQAIGVLIFVDQQMIETAGDLGGDVRLLHHLREIEQEIVVIEHALALLGLDVGCEQAAQRLLEAGAPREVSAERLGERARGC